MLFHPKNPSTQFQNKLYSLSGGATVCGRSPAFSRLARSPPKRHPPPALIGNQDWADCRVAGAGRPLPAAPTLLPSATRCLAPLPPRSTPPWLASFFPLTPLKLVALAHSRAPSDLVLGAPPCSPFFLSLVRPSRPSLCLRPFPAVLASWRNGHSCSRFCGRSSGIRIGHRAWPVV